MKHGECARRRLCKYLRDRNLPEIRYLEDVASVFGDIRQVRNDFFDEREQRNSSAHHCDFPGLFFGGDPVTKFLKGLALLQEPVPKNDFDFMTVDLQVLKLAAGRKDQPLGMLQTVTGTKMAHDAVSSKNSLHVQVLHGRSGMGLVDFLGHLPPRNM